MRVVVGVFCMLVWAFSAWGADFILTSPDVAEGKMLGQKQILNGFGCSGGNVSPELQWRNAPAGTRSFAVTVYDPDAPTGSGWWHWVVFNIPASTSVLPSGVDADSLPAGSVQSRTDFGGPGYGGACPPQGKPHRYVFTVFALDVEKFELTPDSSAAMVGFMLGQHTLAKASIIALYGR